MIAGCQEQYSTIINADELIERCLGNIEFANRILQLLSAQCDSEIVELERAAMHECSDDACRIAHRLKGAFANAAARQLSEYAEGVYRSASDGDFDTARKLVGQLRAGWDNFLEFANAGIQP
jgi:HPt (histidine-containing phosphotransfer) domain-containing protein